MVQFATIAELEDFLGAPIAAGQQAETATLHLQLASAAVQNYCRRRIEYVADDVVQIHVDVPEGDLDAFRLPNYPVWAISALTVNGIAVLAANYVFTRGGRVRGPFGAIPVANAPEPITAWSIIRATYTHGYAIGSLPNPNPLGVTLLPDDIKAVVLSVAARGVDNPTSLAAETIGPGYAVTYGSPAGGVKLNDEDKRILARYRKPQAPVRI